MFSIETIAVLIIGYLIGSIPWAVIVAKRAGVDIFSVGSGNPGATNVLRTLGKPMGYTVFVLDFLKGVFAVCWFQFPLFSFSGDLTLGLWGLPAAVLGHTYPIFTGFRGGKGVATAMGGLLAVMPACLLVGLFVWLLTFYLTKYVAVASIAFGLSLPVCSLVFSASEQGAAGQTILAFVVMGWIVWRHRSNLARLRAGTESRFEKRKTETAEKMSVDPPSSPPAIRIGILGLGTVGQGTWKHLLENASFWPKILGAELLPVRASVQSLSKERAVDIFPGQLTTNSQEIVDDPEIDLICELIGGVEEARALTLRAFSLGKSVVTANKALICEHGEELFQAAEKAGVTYGFEASVAGGIPIIKVLRESLVTNEFPLIYGILNGTSNYILTRMEKEGASFEQVLGDARSLGYVEADEALDLDGVDAAHKAVILAYLAHGIWVNLNEVTVEGIRRISNEDLEAADNLGCRIKLIGVIRRNFSNNHVSVAVHPALIPLEETIARTDGVHNGVCLSGSVVGTVVLTGRGAGQDPTASSVISDIVDVVKGMKGISSSPKLRHVSPEECSPASPEEIEGRFYLRLSVDDRPGQLAKVAECMADHGISLATVSQTPHENDQPASLILTTHQTNEHSIAQVLEKLKDLPGVMDEPVLFRMFDPNGIS